MVFDLFCVIFWLFCVILGLFCVIVLFWVFRCFALLICCLLWLELVLVVPCGVGIIPGNGVCFLFLGFVGLSVYCLFFGFL